jgi:hypothetical protein
MGSAIPNFTVQPTDFGYENPMNLVRQAQVMRMQQEAHAQQMAGGAQDIQLKQTQIDQTKALNDAYQGALTVGPDGTASIDPNKLTRALGQAGHGSAIPSVLKGMTDFQKSTAELSELRGKVAAAENDYAGGIGATLKSANNDPHLFLAAGQHAIDAKAVDPQVIAPLIQHVQQSLQDDPTGEAARGIVSQISDHFIAQSPKQQELINARTQAQARATQAQAAAGNEERTTAQINRQNDAAALAQAARQGPDALAFQLRKLSSLSPDRVEPFMGVNAQTKPEDILAIGITPDQLVTTGEAARHNAVQEANAAALQSIAQGRLDVERAHQGIAQNIYDQTYGSGANPALEGVEPKLRTQATTAAQKAADEYTKAMESSANVQTFIDLARSGNKAAGSNLPIMGAESIQALNGIRRINRTEIEQYQGAGSLLDRINGKIGKVTAGQPIPSDVMDDIQALHQAISGNAAGNYNAKLNGINQNYRSNFQPVKVAPPQGGAQNGGAVPEITNQADYDKLPKGAKYTNNGIPHVKQ